MAEHQRQVCNTDLTRVQSCIRYIVEFDERFPRRAKIPPFFPVDRLAKVYPTEKMVQISAAKAKRSILHALAFLSWWTTVIVTWEENLSAKAVVFDHLTLDKSRLLVSIWPASIQNLKWHIPVDSHSLL